ncbi:MAG TPA: IS607 family element RNA-guided endonuclease TnpB, partial [Actinomycetota bacterium]|nr:IS607 family element RNA-guided endonuclease TnpB [Actinomycetota bacterium]
GLELVKRRLDERAVGEDVPVPWTLAALRREWNRAKHQAAPWWADNSKEAYSSGLDALARALKNFTDAKQGHRAGAPMGFPKRKRKGRSRDACRFTTGAIRVEPDRHHVVLPRLGRIRTHESTRKLARRLEQGTARILAATISRQGGRWFVSFTCQVQRAVPGPHRPGWRVGVDVGIRHLAVLSDGRRVPNPAPLQQAQRRLRRRNRQLARRRGPLAPDGSRREPSKRWQQTSRRLAQAHAKIANLRGNALHHLTSALAGTYGAVVVEHLNIAGMLRNHGLARRIADAGWGELRRQLGYKTAWAGGTLVQADTFYPSSKTCSGCGHVKAKLPLSERTYRCERCGLVLDRDENAARNLAALVLTQTGAEVVAGSGPETRNARGVDVRPGLTGQTAVNREAGTGRRPGETGTVGAQAPTARIADTR